MNLQDAQEILDAIDDRGIGLTNWEANFVDDKLKKTDRGQALTGPEAVKLQEIYLARVACFRDK